ncbi:MAG: hypothetical protein QOC57_1420 [Ilumatobacteraceae bacterium]|jgi:RecG-like helicase
MSLLKRKQRDNQPIQATPDAQATPIAEVAPRQRVRVVGQVIRMTARPTSGEPALAVSISDSTGTVTAVWTGRREIGGITLGRRLAIDGVPVMRGGHLEFTNAGYTLLPTR